MSGMKIKTGGKSVERVGEGTVMARIVSVVTLGEHQVHSQYPEKGNVDKVLLSVELPTETIEVDGNDMPRFLSQTQNLYLNDKSNLYKIIQACDPTADLSEGYDLSQLMGKACMVTIGSTNTGKDKITAWTSPMKGFDVPDQISDSTLFDFYSPDKDAFDGLMDWIKKELQDAANYSGSDLEKVVTGGMEEGGIDEELMPF